MEAEPAFSPHETRLCKALLGLLAGRGGIWSGTAQELLRDLTAFAADREANWPRDGHALRQQLDAIDPQLRTFGVAVTHCKISGQRRLTIARQS